MNTTAPEQKEWTPLIQFLREQEIAKAKVAAARAELVSYFQKRLQGLADEWRSLNGVLNWDMPEFGQALDELQLRPAEAAAKKPRNYEIRPGPKPSMDWEKRMDLFETFADKEGNIQLKNVSPEVMANRLVFYDTAAKAVACGRWEKVRSGKNSIWKVKRPLAT